MKAYLKIEFENGIEARWEVNPKFAWKLFADRFKRMFKEGNSRSKSKRRRKRITKLRL